MLTKKEKNILRNAANFVIHPGVFSCLAIKHGNGLSYNITRDNLTAKYADFYEKSPHWGWKLNKEPNSQQLRSLLILWFLETEGSL